MMTGTVCFEYKTTICNAKFGDLGDNGDRRSTYVVMIKGSLHLSAPLLSIFGRKKLSPVLGKNLTVLGNK